MKTSIFWFRRDLRLEDNTGLFKALASNEKVLVLFIFDENILEELPADDSRVNFIYDKVKSIDDQLKKVNSSVLCLKGNPVKIWKELIANHSIQKVYINKDYEPYATERDEKIKDLLEQNDLELLAFKDSVIFEEGEVTKDNGLPYSIYTPYKNKWLSLFNPLNHLPYPKISFDNFVKETYKFPTLDELGISRSTIKVKGYDLNHLENYKELRNYPNKDSTSYLGPHLRFGTISVRQALIQLKEEDATFVSQLIWREFFMQILYHYPEVVHQSFKIKYDAISWRNNEAEFDLWCKGQTGYPIVDAGMRQLNETGYMHNRIRMVVASFLCKHLLIDWRWGEAYFASKLLDYELSANNGNWQWAAGTGCDAAPYFRIFNPYTQTKKFDKDLDYIKKWVPEFESPNYSPPIVDHKSARERALSTYKDGLSTYNL
jgi:deoxyribodipyrimidine photo-lyase